MESDKTPVAVDEGKALGLEALFSKAMKSMSNLVKAAWAQEYFPVNGTSSENEMSVIQYANICGKRILLTGDAGRDGLSEAAAYAPYVGLDLPGVWMFQVPHHGGRHNVNSEVLDAWLGKTLPSSSSANLFSAICSSAKADEHHPKKSVIRAIHHRGGHFASTEGRNLCLAEGITRGGWSPVDQWPYPDEQEEDPMTGMTDWELVIQGSGIAGVHSASSLAPFKIGDFAEPYKTFENKLSYSEWVFLVKLR